MNINKIILQLTRLDDDEKIERDESINNLTPIRKVYRSGSITDTPYGITVRKFPPKNSKAIMSDFITEIFDKDLFDYFTNMNNHDFHMALNKTIYDYILSKNEEERKLKTWDNNSQYYSPLKAFQTWFENKGIDKDKVQGFKNFNKKQFSEDALWAIADDMRDRKENGEFKSYMEAYRWAAKHINKSGVSFTAEGLERAYHKAKSELRVGDIKKADIKKRRPRGR